MVYAVILVASSPGLKVVENELAQHIRNKNGVADLVDPEGALPELHDWLYGNKVGYAENPFVRGWNAIMPMKVYEGRDRPEADFLTMIEYDTRPVFNVAENGVGHQKKKLSCLRLWVKPVSLDSVLLTGWVSIMLKSGVTLFMVCV